MNRICKNCGDSLGLHHKPDNAGKSVNNCGDFEPVSKLQLEAGTPVWVGELKQQSYIEYLGLDDVNSKESTVGWRDRAPYMSMGGLRSIVGKKGEIYRKLELDGRFYGNWYSVYINTSLGVYEWFNLHESELIMVPHPLLDWLEK